MRRYSPEGQLIDETDVKLADGSNVYLLAGLTFDRAGKPVLAGTSLDGSTSSTLGLFTFD